MKQEKTKRTMQEFESSAYLSGANAPYMEALYDAYLMDVESVSSEWQTYFNSLQNSPVADVSHYQVQDDFRQMAQHPCSTVAAPTPDKQGNVDALITAYRRFGHLNADINPLRKEQSPDTRLQLSYHHLSDADLSTTFNTRTLLSRQQASLQEILDALKAIYCGTMGVEYSRIMDDTEREWLRDYLEHRLPKLVFDTETKKTILKKLSEAEGMEKYLDSKYPGQKRFSIEGGDNLIPLLNELSEQARSANVHELVIGMAHRGRLNVLMNIMGQSPTELFQEFDGTMDYGLTTGDVKYHRGFSSDVKTKAGSMHLSLAFNPSHLEFINTVVMGSVRARQERMTHTPQTDYAMPVLIHGDAAFSGLGIVMETLSMSQTRAYCVGGTIHIILNNQVGFTTSNSEDSRSSIYCSDLAKMIDMPIFHVNGDDSEAVVRAATMALDYRMRFHKDVIIDLVCYRRHGHQEVDEPRATQPLMYQFIRQHPTPKAIYEKQLIAEGVCTEEEVNAWSVQYRDHLDAGRQVVDVLHKGLSENYAANWTPFLEKDWQTQADTAVSMDRLRALGDKVTSIPDGFVLQRNVDMIMKARRKMYEGSQAMDWGYAETMAYATLLDEGYPIRFSGEDSRRGTFFHRHAALFDQNSGEVYEPLMHLNDDQAPLQLYDSLLSEAGTLGFEYGYSTADPNALVIWEAQFGDFANGAQVIIDQFISSAWQKWQRLSGLVMLLPHGYEGMGPEHSSARLERYLQLCAQDNIQVCVPSTPSQMFHLLRRQVLRPCRKPLIVMTPKSLLRHKLAVSCLEDLAQGQLQLVIPEIDELASDQVDTVIACSGKVYYELLEKRRAENIMNIAIIRIEQLYPFPYEVFTQALERYGNAKQLLWVQEEPKNQGAWFCTRDRLMKCLPTGWEMHYVGRHSMAAPAGGYPALHKKQQTDLIHRALNLTTEESL
jgi:2-oxoglutarate dehydrogenase E1 component